MAFLFALTAGRCKRQVGYARPELLVDTAWLAQHLTDSNIRIVDMRARGYGDGHIPEAVLARQQLDPQSEGAADVPADAAGVRGVDVEARHLEQHARDRLRRARRHLRDAAVVDSQLLRPLERRAARRRLGEVGAPNSAPTNATVPTPAAASFKVKPGTVKVATADQVKAAINNAGHEADRRADPGRDRRQGSAQHQARRLHRVVGAGVLGRHARSGDQGVQACRRDREAVSRQGHHRRRTT